MDIKEIALKYSREYLTFKLGGRKGLDVEEIVCDDEIYEEIVNELAQQFEAIISAYKAELLKEVGEPVAECLQEYGCACRWWWTDEGTKLPVGTKLYTSDQVAAAILKATKPLEEERDKAVKRMKAGWIEVCDSGILAFKEMNDELRAQLAAAQEENGRLENQVLARDSELWGRTQAILGLKDQLAKAEQLWQIAQGRCDGLGEKLAKAEQRVAEWQPISTAPKDGAWIVVTSTHNKYYRSSVQFYDGHWYDTKEVIHDDLMENAATHWMPLPTPPKQSMEGV